MRGIPSHGNRWKGGAETARQAARKKRGGLGMEPWGSEGRGTAGFITSLSIFNQPRDNSPLTTNQSCSDVPGTKPIFSPLQNLPIKHPNPVCISLRLVFGKWFSHVYLLIYRFISDIRPWSTCSIDRIGVNLRWWLYNPKKEKEKRKKKVRNGQKKFLLRIFQFMDFAC